MGSRPQSIRRRCTAWRPLPVLCSTRCGSAKWLPRRHGAHPVLHEYSTHDHLTASSFIPRVLSLSTTESTRASHISISNIPNFLECCTLAFIFLSTLQHFIFNNSNKYWFSIDMFLSSHLHSYPHLFTHLSTHYRHFFILPMYANATSEDPSARPSRTTPGIEPTVAWAPTSQR
ncbi:hypothetical protein B0H10DRAFT_2194785 [Mycena sp. CBHHK59/15]|nr:hypothetical protein B0H10DRAFT_2194785 [Mycena sp. CBHHK59/15]